MNRDFSAVVLAGGKSSRMGQDKAMLSFNNSTFLQHAVDLLKEFTDKIFISSNRSFENIFYPIIEDEINGIGPLGGIYSVLKQTTTQKLLVIAVDTPLLKKSVIEKLLENINQKEKLSIVKTEDGLQMLVGLYDKSLIPLIEQQIVEKDYKLGHLLDKTNFKIIEVQNATDIFMNINTKEDYNIILKNNK